MWRVGHAPPSEGVQEKRQLETETLTQEDGLAWGQKLTPDFPPATCTCDRGGAQNQRLRVEMSFLSAA